VNAFKHLCYHMDKHNCNQSPNEVWHHLSCQLYWAQQNILYKVAALYCDLVLSMLEPCDEPYEFSLIVPRLKIIILAAPKMFYYWISETVLFSHHADVNLIWCLLATKYMLVFYLGRWLLHVSVPLGCDIWCWMLMTPRKKMAEALTFLQELDEF
jgi:hypothetical protein